MKIVDNYFSLCYFNVVNQLNMCRMKYPGDRHKPPEGVTLTGVIGRSGRLWSAILQEDALRQTDGKAANRRDRIRTALWRIPRRSGCRRCKARCANLSGERTETVSDYSGAFDWTDERFICPFLYAGRHPSGKRQVYGTERHTVESGHLRDSSEEIMKKAIVPDRIVVQQRGRVVND